MGAGATSEVLFAALFADFEVVVAMELGDFVLDRGKLVMRDLRSVHGDRKDTQARYRSVYGDHHSSD